MSRAGPPCGTPSPLARAAPGERRPHSAGPTTPSTVRPLLDPENHQRAEQVYQFTIDVSDELPVSLAPVRQFLDR
ncbi:hypothetical protein ACFFTQ_20745 [Streptomyces roseofulvus]|uniref:cyanobactin maturation protease PatG family protein n=1 Tax=Streptomyces roseofulvus TaxID=33902 RepID=UPI0035ED8AC8